MDSLARSGGAWADQVRSAWWRIDGSGEERRCAGSSSERRRVDDLSWPLWMGSAGPSMASLVFLCFLFNLIMKADIVRCVNHDLCDILSEGDGLLV